MRPIGLSALLMAATAVALLSVGDTIAHAEKRLPTPVELEGVVDVPILVYVEGGDVLKSDAGGQMGDALEREIVASFRAAGLRPTIWRPTLADSTHLDIRVEVWSIDGVRGKALLAIRAEFTDQVRTSRRPARAVSAATWWRSGAEVIDATRAAAPIQKQVRETANSFLSDVQWANKPERK